MFEVDNFVRKMKEMDYEPELNERAKELMEENKVLKGKVELLSSPQFMQGRTSGPEKGFSSEAQEEMRKNQEQIKSYLEQLV